MNREEIIRAVRQLNPDELQRLALFLETVAPNRPEQSRGRRECLTENQKRDKEPDHQNHGSEK